MSSEKPANTAKYLLVGNRAFVLDEMFRLGLNVGKILAVKGSYLDRQMQAFGKDFVAVENRDQVIREIESADFDILVSNGCPWILPVNDWQGSGRRFINIHPSHLPDLRGRDPVPGAILYGRDSGATCHVMDAGVDTGDIIAQVRIPYSEDLDAGLLYQLTFQAEREVFEKSCERGFEPLGGQPVLPDTIYYSKKDSDPWIDFRRNDAEVIVRKIRAFSNRSQGARFEHQGKIFKVYDVEIIENEYLNRIAVGCSPGEIVFKYENTLAIKVCGGLLKLKCVEGELGLFSRGDVL